MPVPGLVVAKQTYRYVFPLPTCLMVIFDRLIIVNGYATIEECCLTPLPFQCKEKITNISER